MLNKKGVSEVVANVLIVLLVIVGVGVIWSVVKPTIDKAGKDINADCFTVKVSPVSCTKPVLAATATQCNSANTAATCASLSVAGTAGCTWNTGTSRCDANPAVPTIGYTVKRDAGTGSFQGFKLSFEDITGATQIVDKVGVVSELATASDTVTPNANFVVAKMNVAAIVGTAAETKTCEMLSAPITCA